jgi:hypothetical protein
VINDIKIQDLSAMVQSVAAVVSLAFAFFTIRHVTSTSHREKSVDAYMYLSETYATLSARRRALRELRDPLAGSVSKEEIEAYFKDYWMFVYREYELYRAGAVSRETYLSWTLALHEYLSNGKGEYYADANNDTIYVTPAETMNAFLVRGRRYYPDFVHFLAKLTAVPQPASDRDIPRWQGQILRIIASVRKYRL